MSDRKPKTELIKLNSMQAEVTDIVDLFEKGTQSPIDIYDRADFTHGIERATLGLQPIGYVSDELRIGVNGLIQMTLGDRNGISSVEKFRKSLVSSYSYSDILVKPTKFNNLFTVSDKKNPGGNLYVANYQDGQISITNNQVFRGQDESPIEVIAEAPEIHTIDPDTFMKGVIRSFMFLVEKGYQADSLSHEGLKRKFIINGSRKSRLANYGQNEAPRKSPKKNSKTAVNSEFAPTKPGEIKLSDVGGLKLVKDQLAEIAIAFGNPEIMEKWGAKKPQGLILYGEPGTGKTMLAKALAGEIGADIMFVQGNDIYNMWLGESERRIKELFEQIKSLRTRTVVVFDEFDSIIGTTEEVGPGGGGQARNAVAGIFKQELNSLGDTNPNILLVATTNSIDRIDPALVRTGRFDYKLYIPMPDEDGRAEIISIIISRALTEKSSSDDFLPYADDINIPELIQLTDGMSGADMTEIFRRITMKKAINEAQTGSSQQICQADLLNTINSFRTNG